MFFIHFIFFFNFDLFLMFCIFNPAKIIFENRFLLCVQMQCCTGIAGLVSTSVRLNQVNRSDLGSSFFNLFLSMFQWPRIHLCIFSLEKLLISCLIDWSTIRVSIHRSSSRFLLSFKECPDFQCFTLNLLFYLLSLSFPFSLSLSLSLTLLLSLSPSSLFSSSFFFSF